MKQCYIVAEAGVNHNGSEEVALRLVEEAARAGVDAVKFQTFKAENLVSKEAKTTEYQKKQTGEGSQFNMLKKLEIPKKLHIKLIDKCEQLNIDFLSTPFDIETADFLVGLGMCKIKIPSGELTNIPFIKKLAGFNKPLILSTGMSTLDEVVVAVDTIKSVRKKRGFEEVLEDKLTVLHCTSNYPAKYQDVNLQAMKTIEKELSLPVGYSDHTEGVLVAVCAVAMGATIIEKHFTLDKNLVGPDHKASLDLSELRDMVKQIRDLELCLGDGVKAPRESELSVRELVRRSVVLNVDKSVGDIIELDNLTLLRPGGGIPPIDLKKIVGRRVLSNCKAGAVLQWSDLN